MADLELGDFSMASSTSDVAGANMMTGVGSTLNQLANLLSGPVLWVVVGASIVMTLYGLGAFGGRQGGGEAGGPSLKITITGIGTLLLTAVLKGLAGKLHGM